MLGASTDGEEAGVWLLRAAGVLSASVLFTSTARAEDVSRVFELSLNDEAAVTQLGGTVEGGTFSAGGWTTTTRADRIVVPLPSGIDASKGRLSVSFTSPELAGPSGYFESWILVSLDTDAGPYTPTAAGTAGVQAVYVAHHELGTPLFKAKGYFNLFDAGCVDWRDCTGERGTPDGWLGDGTGDYTIAHAWDGAADVMTMSGGASTITRTLDLSDTTPAGVIDAPQWHLLVNACGGSTHNACGHWDGQVKGGPLGVVYQSVALELVADCGDGVCQEHIESCEVCASDCGPCGDGTGGSGAAGAEGGAGGSDAQATSTNGSGGTAGSMQSGATGGAPPTEGGGCRQAPAGRSDGSFALLLLGIAACVRRR